MSGLIRFSTASFFPASIKLPRPDVTDLYFSLIALPAFENAFDARLPVKLSSALAPLTIAPPVAFAALTACLPRKSVA